MRETQNLILILLPELCGPQFPQLYTHEKMKCHIIPKVSFSMKNFMPLKWSMNQEFWVVSSVQFLSHSFLEKPNFKHSNSVRYDYAICHM